jgi:DNA-binding transcriptional ArsR family regulator
LSVPLPHEFVDATVLELAEPFAISLPAISRHLKVLEQAGLISRGRRWTTIRTGSRDHHLRQGF